MKKNILFGLAAALFFASSALKANTESAEIEKLRAEIAELKNIQTLIARTVGLGELVRPETLLLEGAHLVGKDDSPYVLIEFTDLHCPFCARFNTEQFPSIKAEYIDKGTIQFASYDYPLLSIHPNAGYAALMQLCAADQGQYLQAKDALFKKGPSLDEDFIDNFPKSLSLDNDVFKACLNDPQSHSKIASSVQYAEMLGFKSTPVFILGKRQGEEVVDYLVINGVLAKDRLDNLLEQLKK